MPTQPSPRQNHLLAALPRAVYDRLLPNLELVEMPLGEVLSTAGAELRYVYFPTTCIVSLVYVMANGSTAEIALTGYEGLLGVSLLLGGETTPSQAVVQSAGHAYRIKGEAIKYEFEQGGPLGGWSLVDRFGSLFGFRLAGHFRSGPVELFQLVGRDGHGSDSSLLCPRWTEVGQAMGSTEGRLRRLSRSAFLPGWIGRPHLQSGVRR